MEVNQERRARGEEKSKEKNHNKFNVFLGCMGLRNSVVPGLQGFLFDSKKSLLLVGKWTPGAFPVLLLLG